MSGVLEMKMGIESGYVGPSLAFVEYGGGAYAVVCCGDWMHMQHVLYVI